MKATPLRMLAYRLAEQCGEADVDALMERTPVTHLMEWAAFWGIQADAARPDGETPEPPPEGAPMTPEIAETLVHGFRGVLGVGKKRKPKKEAPK